MIDGGFTLEQHHFIARLLLTVGNYLFLAMDFYICSGCVTLFRGKVSLGQMHVNRSAIVSKKSKGC